MTPLETGRFCCLSPSRSHTDSPVYDVLFPVWMSTFQKFPEQAGPALPRPWPAQPSYWFPTAVPPTSHSLCHFTQEDLLAASAQNTPSLLPAISLVSVLPFIFKILDIVLACKRCRPWCPVCVAKPPVPWMDTHSTINSPSTVQWQGVLQVAECATSGTRTDQAFPSCCPLF